MNAPQHTQAPQNQGQGSFPVFKSDRLEGSPSSMALWANMEATGPHVKGRLTQVAPTGEQYTTNVTGFFKISEKGDVQIQLSSRQGDRFGPEGTLYVQRGGELKFYPKDKAHPQLVVRATDAMSQEVADAIGVKRAEPRQAYGQQNHQESVSQAPAAPRQPAAYQQPAPQAPQAPQRPQTPPPAPQAAATDQSYAWDDPVSPPVNPPAQQGGRPRFG